MDVSLLIRLIDQASAPAKKIADSLRGIGDVAGEMKRGFGDAIRQGFSVENIETATRNAEAALERARARLLGAVGLGLTLAAPVMKAAEFDQSMRGLDKVLDVSASRLAQLRKFALDTSALVPISAGSLLELMSEAAQGGVPEAELEAFSLYVAKAAVAFDMAGAEIGDRFAKLRNVYKLNQQGIEDLGDATNYLSNSQASGANEITDFANRAAGAAIIFKLTATQIAAVGSAMISAGIAPETAARGFTAMATRILGGGKDIDDAFKSIGMNRKKFMKELEADAPGALLKLFDTMSKSPKGMQAMIDLVGQDFADDFAKLLGNPELLAEALALVADRQKYAGSATEEAAKVGAGAVKRWELLTGKLTKLAIVAGDILLPAFFELTDALGGLIDKVSAFAEANPELTGYVVKGAAGLMAMSIAGRVLAFGLAAARLPLIRLASTFLKFNTDGRNIATGWRVLSGSARVLTGALLGLVRLVPGLRGAALGLSAFSAAASGGFLATALTGIATAAGAVASALAAVTAPVWVVVGVLAAAGLAVWKYWDRVSSFASGFASVFGSLFSDIGAKALDLANTFIDFHAKLLGIPADKVAAFKASIAKAFDFSGLIEGAKAKIGELWTWIGSFFSQEKLSDGEKGQMYAAGQKLATDLIEGFKAFLSSAIGGINQLLTFSLEIQWPTPPAWLQWIIDRANPMGGATSNVSNVIDQAQQWYNGTGGTPATQQSSAAGASSDWSFSGILSSVMGGSADAGSKLAEGGERSGQAVAKGGQDAASALSWAASEIRNAASGLSGAVARAAAAASNSGRSGNVSSAVSRAKTGTLTDSGGGGF